MKWPLLPGSAHLAVCPVVAAPDVEGGQLGGVWGWMMVRGGNRDLRTPTCVTSPSHHAPCPLGSCMATPAYLAPWPSASSSGFQICLFFAVCPGTWTRAKSLLVFPLPSRQLLGSDEASLCSNGRMARGVTKFLVGLRLALAVFGRRGS